jgi:uncharacterized protein YpmS
MGRLLFIAFVALVIVLVVLVVSKIIDSGSKKTDEEAKNDFMNEIEKRMRKNK